MLFRSGLVYIEGGLTFTTDAPNLLQYWGPTDVENADPTGAALYSSEIDPPLVVTLTAGGTFDLISFQLAEADNSPIAFAATFRYTDGSGIHSSILNHAAASGLQTYVLNLNGITSFELTDIDFQIDNITYNVTPVPELSTYALLSLGLAAISARIRRRR